MAQFLIIFEGPLFHERDMWTTLKSLSFEWAQSNAPPNSLVSKTQLTHLLLIPISPSNPVSGPRPISTVAKAKMPNLSRRIPRQSYKHSLRVRAENLLSPHKSPKSKALAGSPNSCNSHCQILVILPRHVSFLSRVLHTRDQCRRFLANCVSSWQRRHFFSSESFVCESWD